MGSASGKDFAYKTAMKILVIEDDREAANYLQKALSEAGHTAHLASDGETGFAIADSNEYDVLVVDRAGVTRRAGPGLRALIVVRLGAARHLDRHGRHDGDAGGAHRPAAAFGRVGGGRGTLTPADRWAVGRVGGAAPAPGWGGAR